MISYRPLKDLLYHNDIKMIELINDGIVTPNISVKLNKDTGYVNLSTIDKVCNYLSQRLNRTVAIDEVAKFIPDQPEE